MEKPGLRAEEISTRVVPLVEVGGETVSSTRIRALVAAGDVGGHRVDGLTRRVDEQRAGRRAALVLAYSQ